MKKQKLKLYFDESGDCTVENSIVFGCIAFEESNKTINREEIEKIFKKFHFNWQNFHSVAIKDKQKIELLLKEIKEISSINLYISTIKLTQNNPNIYYPLLIETILRITKKENYKANPIDIIIEHRENIDIDILEKYTQIRLIESHNIKQPPPIRISPIFKGEDIFLAVADALAHLYFKNKLEFLKRVSHFSFLDNITKKYEKFLKDKNKKEIKIKIQNKSPKEIIYRDKIKEVTKLYEN